MNNTDINIFPNPVIIYGSNWNILSANRAALKSLGYNNALELQGKHIREIIHNIEHEQLEDILQALAADDSMSPKSNLCHLHKNGWKIKLIAQFSRIEHEGNNSKEAFIESAISLRELPECLNKPNHSPENYSVLAENIPGLEVFLVDKELNIHSRLGNETGKQGWNRKSNQENNFLSYFPPHILEILHPLLKVALGGTPISQEFADKEEHFSVRLIPLTSDHIISRCVIVLQNTTETKLVENKLKHSKEESEEANRAKDNFVAKMSHEIRTPLNAISGFAEQLVKTPLNKQQEEYLQVVTNSSKHLLSLIDDILVLSKIELGQIEMDEVPFTLPDIIKAVKEMLEIKYKGKKLDFHTIIPSSLKGQILGDPAKIRQVLLNLTTNAIKFTHQGSITLSLSLEQDTPSLQKVRFQVRDTGIGISKNEWQNIFRPFHQVDSAFDRMYTGCGLGLTISKDLIERMGGSMVVESVPAKGSTFTFALDFKKSAGKVDNLPTETEAKVSLHHIRILFVDDDPVNRKLGEIILSKFKVNADFARSGLEAIKYFQPGKYNLIFLDINMPDINGIEVTRYIRQIESTSSINTETHIVAMTANAVSKHLKQYLKSGMDSIMLKPYDEETIYRKLISVVNKDIRRQIEPEKTPFADSSSSGFDLDQLLSITRGDNEFTQLMMDIFVENGEKLLSKIKNSHKNNNFTAIADAAHTLAPSVEQLGMKKATLLLKEVEAKYLENLTHFTQKDHDLIYNTIDEVQTGINLIKEASLNRRNNKQTKQV